MTTAPDLSSGQIQGNPENYRCTQCRALNDGFTSLKPEQYPKPGCLSLCAYCGTLHTFTVDGLARMSLEEETAMPAETKREIARLRAGLQRLQHAQKTGLPPGYYADAEAMLAAAKAWIASHPNACLMLNALDPDRLPIGAAQRAMLKDKLRGLPVDAKIAYIAALTDVIDWWAGNEDTRAFLTRLDEACEHRATYMQAQAVLETLWAPSDAAPAVPS